MKTIIRLDPDLDKLRNKELSFGCVIDTAIYEKEQITITSLFDVCWSIEKFTIWDRLPHWEKIYCRVLEYGWNFGIDNIYNTIWHPLTRWRAERMGMKAMSPDIKDEVETYIDRFESVKKIMFDIRIILSSYHLIDKNELQWQAHEKRPKLKDLLKQLSDYL